jgi:hypothetical protein
MPRRAMLAFGMVVLAGLILAAALALTRESRLVYTLGAGPAAPVAVLRGGQQACQKPVDPPAERFDRVVVSLGTFGRPGPPLDVLLRPQVAGAPTIRGRLPGGYPDVAVTPEHAIPVSATLRAPAAICLKNRGPGRVAVFGATGLAHRTSSATVAGKPIRGDLAIRLESARPRSLLSRLPDAFRHAALFKASWVGAWTFWVLTALVLVAVPLVMAWAVARASREPA